MYEKITYYSRMSQTLHVPVPAPPSGTTLKNGLVAFWEFQADNTDSTLNHNDLTAQGTWETFVPGLVGNCANYVSTLGTDCLTGGPNAGFNIVAPQAWSFAIWFNPPTVAGSPDLMDKVAVADGTFQTRQCALNLASGTNFSVVFYYYDATAGADIFNLVQNSTDLNHWNLAIVVSDGTTIYGSYNDSLLTDAQITITKTPISDSGLFIRMLNAGGTQADNNTKIDQVGWWNRALTQDEVDLLWNGGAGLAYSAM